MKETRSAGGDDDVVSTGDAESASAEPAPVEPGSGPRRHDREGGQGGRDPDVDQPRLRIELGVRPSVIVGEDLPGGEAAARLSVGAPLDHADTVPPAATGQNHGTLP